MTQGEGDESSWALVGKRGKIIKRNLTASMDSNTFMDSVRKPLTTKQAKARVNRNKQVLKEEQSFIVPLQHEFNKLVSSFLESHSTVYFISYGIGRIFQSSVSQFQLALLLLLVDWLRETREDLHLQIYDPVLRSNEMEYLKSLGFEVLTENEECKRTLYDDQRAIFFMPHCENFMYNNLVKANECNLQRILIIGNSFQHYDECTLSSTKRNKIAHILTLASSANEFPFPLCLCEPSAFNNTCLISFEELV